MRRIKLASLNELLMIVTWHVTISYRMMATHEAFLLMSLLLLLLVM